jgi:hypothetical protein
MYDTSLSTFVTSLISFVRNDRRIRHLANFFDIVENADFSEGHSLFYLLVLNINRCIYFVGQFQVAGKL